MNAVRIFALAVAVLLRGLAVPAAEPKPRLAVLTEMRGYESAPLFTLRGADDLPLARSGCVRVFHAFGDRAFNSRGKNRKWRQSRS